jgi:hypothetical protein
MEDFIDIDNEKYEDEINSEENQNDNKSKSKSKTRSKVHKNYFIILI